MINIFTEFMYLFSKLSQLIGLVSGKILACEFLRFHICSISMQTTSIILNEKDKKDCLIEFCAMRRVNLSKLYFSLVQKTGFLGWRLQKDTTIFQKMPETPTFERILLSGSSVSFRLQKSKIFKTPLVYKELTVFVRNLENMNHQLILLILVKKYSIA